MPEELREDRDECKRELVETPQRRSDPFSKSEWNLRDQPLKGRMLQMETAQYKMPRVCTDLRRKEVGLMGTEDYIGGSTWNLRGGQITNNFP